MATGDLFITNDAFLFTGNDALDMLSEGGPIALSGRLVSIEENSQIFSSSDGVGKGGPILINAPEVRIVDHSNVITASNGVFALLGGGDITITATNTLLMDNGALVSTGTKGGGNSGSITFDVGRLDLCNESSVMTNTNDPGLALQYLGVTGNASNIIVMADDVAVQSGSKIVSYSGLVGDSGSVSLSSTGNVLVSGSSPNLTSQIGTFVIQVKEVLADVLISAPEGSVDIENGARLTAIAAKGAFKSSGTIDVKARRFNVSNTIMGTESGSMGGSGDIHLHIADRLTVVAGNIRTSNITDGFGAGDAGDIKISAKQVELSAGSWVSSISDTGDTGDITILEAQSIVVDDSDITSTTLGAGSAGDIEVTASSLEVRNGDIQAATNGLGDSGNITINVDRLIVTAGGGIGNSCHYLGSTPDGQVIGSTGGGGRIGITANESVELIGADADDNDSSIANANFDGTGTDREINIRTPLLIMDQGEIQGQTFGSGRAADVNLEVNRLILLNGASIGTETSPGFTLPSGVTFLPSTGDGGTIHVSASESVVINGAATTGYFTPDRE